MHRSASQCPMSLQTTSASVSRDMSRILRYIIRSSILYKEDVDIVDSKVNITWSGPPPVQGEGGSPVPAVRTQVRHPQAVPGQAQHDRHRQQHQVQTDLVKLFRLVE